MALSRRFKVQFVFVAVIWLVILACLAYRLLVGELSFIDLDTLVLLAWAYPLLVGVGLAVEVFQRRHLAPGTARVRRRTIAPAAWRRCRFYAIAALAMMPVAVVAQCAYFGAAPPHLFSAAVANVILLLGVIATCLYSERRSQAAQRAADENGSMADRSDA